MDPFPDQRVQNRTLILDKEMVKNKAKAEAKAQVINKE
jgi:hypothetical protein